MKAVNLCWISCLLPKLAFNCPLISPKTLPQTAPPLRSDVKKFRRIPRFFSPIFSSKGCSDFISSKILSIVSSGRSFSTPLGIFLSNSLKNTISLPFKVLGCDVKPSPEYDAVLASSIICSCILSNISP